MDTVIQNIIFAEVITMAKFTTDQYRFCMTYKRMCKYAKKCDVLNVDAKGEKDDK